MKYQVNTRQKTPFAKIILLLMMVFTSYTKAQEQQISISEALQISYANNEKIKQYNERLQQKVYEDKAAKGNFLPSLNKLIAPTALLVNSIKTIDRNNLFLNFINVMHHTFIESSFCNFNKFRIFF
mgnify:CR=1 FL=1